MTGDPRVSPCAFGCQSRPSTSEAVNRRGGDQHPLLGLSPPSKFDTGKTPPEFDAASCEGLTYPRRPMAVSLVHCYGFSISEETLSVSEIHNNGPAKRPSAVVDK